MALTKVNNRMIDDAFANVKDFGAVGDGTTDDTSAINAAINSVKSTGGTVYFPQGDYVHSGGYSHTHTDTVTIRFKGEGWQTSQISHTGDNTLFTFIAGGYLFAKVEFEDLRIKGEAANSNAVCMSISDSWGNAIRRCYIDNYQAGTAVRLYNYQAWTEGFTVQDCMFRQNFINFKFERQNSSGGTGSFAYFNMKNTAVILNTSSATGFLLNEADAADELHLYAASIEVSTAMTSGGTQLFFVSDNSKFVSSTLNVYQDAIPQLQGTDNFTIKVNNGGLVDVDGTSHLIPSPPQSTSTLSDGDTLNIMQSILNYEAAEHEINGRSSIYWRGMKLQLGETGMSTDRTITMINLPRWSQFKLRLSVRGTNQDYVTTYLVETHGDNVLASVTELGLAATANFYIDVFGGGTGGATSVGNGEKFDIVLNAGSAAGSSYDYYLDIEMI